MSNEQEIALILAEDPDRNPVADRLVPLTALDRPRTGMVPRRPTMDQQEARIIAGQRAKMGTLLENL